MVKITLPDGSGMEFEGSVSGAAVAERIGAGLAKAALAVKVDGELCDLAAEIGQDASVEIVTANELDARRVASILNQDARERDYERRCEEQLRKIIDNDRTFDVC